ncbi:hypothetical protein K488DRAFT_50747 [Vararia minispora EC-137]|uniref:Uncharacterized protein n=1 Tax=Vararia minispora EC-137 TaxID=1314806 RepID=A0ACB8QL12_9AGAM|nr:hypothetical protein K488DRAFT_50747 [Vararia minispora EC-137]
MAAAARKTKSTLDFHQIPNFYCCYLLKSVRTTRATATYIGSTPNPSRRIRQHNGEISAGAWKTKHNRPWIMQMIVHGFPSKLAALQFEWAWQHPHVSRHLRDQDGKALFPGTNRPRMIKTLVKVVRTMVASFPYTTWPLHVKFFTEEAERLWNTLSGDPTIPPLPIGLTVRAEFEGVDGKSGKVGSGRCGPVDVTDAVFTSSHLAKHEAILASGRRLHCVVCKDALDTYQTKPLDSTLCPTPGCTATAHLACLGHHFLSLQPSSTGLVPRGGECPRCQSYILWGDIARGSCRRHAGGVAAHELDNDDQSDVDEVASLESEDLGQVLRPLFRSSGSGMFRGKEGGTMACARRDPWSLPAGEFPFSCPRSS